MAAILWSDVTAIAAELASASPLKQSIILDYVNNELDPLAFGTDATTGEASNRMKMARIYMAAHLASLGPHTAILTQEKEGDLEQMYTLPPIPMGDDPFWERTAYGAAYQSLIKRSHARLPFVIGGS